MIQKFLFCREFLSEDSAAIICLPQIRQSARLLLQSSELGPPLPPLVRMGDTLAGELSRKQVGTECGIESPIASILEAGIAFSSRGNRFLRGVNSKAELIPPEESMSRNKLPVAININTTSTPVVLLLLG